MQLHRLSKETQMTRGKTQLNNNTTKNGKKEKLECSELGLGQTSPRHATRPRLPPFRLTPLDCSAEAASLLPHPAPPLLTALLAALGALFRQPCPCSLSTPSTLHIQMIFLDILQGRKHLQLLSPVPLCSPGWPGTHRGPFVSTLLSAGIKSKGC